MHTRNTYEENLCILHRQGRFIAAYNRAEMPECIFMKQEYRAENKKKNNQMRKEKTRESKYTATHTMTIGNNNNNNKITNKFYNLRV